MPTLLPVFGNGPLVGAAAYAVEWPRTQSPKLKVGILHVLPLFELGWAIPSGARAAVVALMAMIIIVRYYGASRLPSRGRSRPWHHACLFCSFFPFVRHTPKRLVITKRARQRLPGRPWKR